MNIPNHCHDQAESNRRDRCDLPGKRCRDILRTSIGISSSNSAVAAAAAVAAVSRRLFPGKSPRRSHRSRLIVRLLVNIERLWFYSEVLPLDVDSPHMELKSADFCYVTFAESPEHFWTSYMHDPLASVFAIITFARFPKRGRRPFLAFRRRMRCKGEVLLLGKSLQ